MEHTEMKHTDYKIESLLQHLHGMSFFLEPKLFTAEIMVKKLGTPFQLLQIGTEEERDEKESLLQHLHGMSFFLEPKLSTAEIMVKKLGTPLQLLQIGTEEERDEKPSQKNQKRGKQVMFSTTVEEYGYGDSRFM
ncbi:unnamed protein product [Brassica oleracea]|uniref:(rape) hypothetical protein n=1 Tax=Brassica napus TaxID=3708 RepID=A0A816JMG1_BRANA|nr:unnamed protein product [Brassica napus]